ncbi:hypothetical protein G9A89_011288 [Geosiphon pyriformis]|nr:hypothetical protein G9A89_011288 [Geosiphon pyriformis]
MFSNIVRHFVHGLSSHPFALAATAGISLVGVGAFFGRPYYESYRTAQKGNERKITKDLPEQTGLKAGQPMNGEEQDSKTHSQPKGKGLREEESKSNNSKEIRRNQACPKDNRTAKMNHRQKIDALNKEFERERREFKKSFDQSVKVHEEIWQNLNQKFDKLDTSFQNLITRERKFINDLRLLQKSRRETTRTSG